MVQAGSRFNINTSTAEATAEVSAEVGAEVLVKLATGRLGCHL